MPIAIRAMEEAAKKAGLAVDEVGLDKLMEQGKLGLEVFPHFARELRNIAGNNDAVGKAIRENFQPALTRATNTLRTLQNDIFQGGLKQSLMFMLNGFSDLGEESRGLARSIGTVLGGAILGLTFPFGLLWAAILDVQKALEDTFGLRMEQDVLKMTAAVIGMTASFAVLYKIVKMVVKSMGALIAAKKALGSLAGKVTGGGKSDAKRGKVSNTRMARAAAATFLPEILGVAARFGAMTGVGALIPTSLGVGTAEGTQFSNMSNDAAFSQLQQQLSQGQNIKIDLNLNQNAKEFINAEINNNLQLEYDSVYNTSGSSKD